MELKILTLNVNAFRSCHTTAKYRQFIKKIESLDADIICLQENRNSIQGNPFNGYHLASFCRTNQDIENTIFVKKRLSYTDNYCLDITNGAPVQRCVSFVKLYGGTRIANVHLCGGRFDDKDYQALPNVKADEISHVISQQPDFIIGDFNSESNGYDALTSLTRYPLFDKLHLGRKLLFFKYYTSHHQVIEKHGYQSIPLKSPTSIYGGKPDNIYYKADLWTLGSVSIIDTLQYTDHNGVLSVFRKRY